MMLCYVQLREVKLVFEQLGCCHPEVSVFGLLQPSCGISSFGLRQLNVEESLWAPS